MNIKKHNERDYLIKIPSFRKIDKDRTFFSKLIFDFLKRVLEFIMALIAIILSCLFMLLISVVIKADSKGKVIYKHKRVGLRGKEFYLYKFRSMKITDKSLEEIFTAEQMKEYKKNYKVYNDPRITRVGKFLRRTSLDELPQLFNILLGHMSFVGPRPIVQEETELYGDDRNLLLSVMPGLTGYWQVNGRSDTTYERRIDMELYYVKNRNIFLDIKIILKTIAVIFSQKGAN